MWGFAKCSLTMKNQPTSESKVEDHITIRDRKLTFGSLFAGIGGMDLGLERSGLECRWQVEINPFCRAVLEKHWPHVKRYEDIKTVDFHALEKVDVISGGFPCQDVSLAGERRGFEGERSSLWFQMWECVCVLQPRFVVVENVAGLLSLGLGRVLGDLARIGYDCEWESLSAASFGAEHRRQRLFIVAYPHSARSQVWRNTGANGSNEGVFGSWDGFAKRVTAPGLERCGASRWSRDVHGIPRRVDRIIALGNSVVPQIAEWIGNRISTLESEPSTIGTPHQNPNTRSLRHEGSSPPNSPASRARPGRRLRARRPGFFGKGIMIHILIALLLFAGQHKLPKPVQRPCQTCVWVMQ